MTCLLYLQKDTPLLDGQRSQGQLVVCRPTTDLQTTGTTCQKDKYKKR